MSRDKVWKNYRPFSFFYSPPSFTVTRVQQCTVAGGFSSFFSLPFSLLFCVRQRHGPTRLSLFFFFFSFFLDPTPKLRARARLHHQSKHPFFFLFFLFSPLPFPPLLPRNSDTCQSNKKRRPNKMRHSSSFFFFFLCLCLLPLYRVRPLR